MVRVVGEAIGTETPPRTRSGDICRPTDTPGAGVADACITRLRTTGLAGTSAILLVLGMSGAVAAAGLMAAATLPAAPITDPAPDTSRTWEDIDGNGVDDDCQAVPAVANPTVAAEADAAVDANGDGTISVSEAAHSGRIGGPNCNHGGYVSSVARAQGECAAPETPDTSDPGAPADEPPTFTLAAATGDEDDQGDQAEQEDPGDQGDEAEQGDPGDQGEDADEGDQGSADGGQGQEAVDGGAADCTVPTATTALTTASHDAKDARKSARQASHAAKVAAHLAAKAARAEAKAARQAAHVAAKTKAPKTHETSAHGKHASNAKHGKGANKHGH